MTGLRYVVGACRDQVFSRLNDEQLRYSWRDYDDLGNKIDKSKLPPEIVEYAKLKRILERKELYPRQPIFPIIGFGVLPKVSLALARRQLLNVTRSLSIDQIEKMPKMEFRKFAGELWDGMIRRGIVKFNNESGAVSFQTPQNPSRQFQNGLLRHNLPIRRDQNRYGLAPKGPRQRSEDSFDVVIAALGHYIDGVEVRRGDFRELRKFFDGFDFRRNNLDVLKFIDRAMPLFQKGLEKLSTKPVYSRRGKDVWFAFGKGTSKEFGGAWFVIRDSIPQYVVRRYREIIEKETRMVESEIERQKNVYFRQKGEFFSIWSQYQALPKSRRRKGDVLFDALLKQLKAFKKGMAYYEQAHAMFVRLGAGEEADESITLPVKALSVRNPWAHMLVGAVKNNDGSSMLKSIELRRTNVVGGFRGPVLIHASKTFGPFERNGAKALGLPIDFDSGGFIGIADIVDVIPTDHFLWETFRRRHQWAHQHYIDWTPFDGPIFFNVLANPIAFKTLIPRKAALGLINARLSPAEQKAILRELKSQKPPE